jgi:hypothetical protein
MGIVGIVSKVGIVITVRVVRRKKKVIESNYYEVRNWFDDFIFTSRILLHYFIDVICIIGMPCCTPYIGVFPKWSRVLIGSILILIALGPISFMETGTLVTNGTGRRKPGLNDIVAVPLYVVVIPFFIGLPVILKSVIVCIWGEVPLNITIFNVALKAGELEFPCT